MLTPDSTAQEKMEALDRPLNTIEGKLLWANKTQQVKALSNMVNPLA